MRSLVIPIALGFILLASSGLAAQGYYSDPPESTGELDSILRSAEVAYGSLPALAIKTWLAYSLLFWVVTAGFCLEAARAKGYGTGCLGAVFGLLFGPIALLFYAALPDRHLQRLIEDSRDREKVTALNEALMR